MGLKKGTDQNFEFVNHFEDFKILESFLLL